MRSSCVFNSSTYHKGLILPGHVCCVEGEAAVTDILLILKLILCYNEMCYNENVSVASFNALTPPARIYWFFSGESLTLSCALEYFP